MTAQTYTGPSGALKKDSAWLSSEDFPLPFERVVQVLDVELHRNVKFEAGREEAKVGALRFKEFEKAMVLNATNRKMMRALFSNDTAQWRGKYVTLWVDTKVRNPAGGALVCGLRVKAAAQVPRPAPDASESSGKGAGEASTGATCRPLDELITAGDAMAGEGTDKLRLFWANRLNDAERVALGGKDGPRMLAWKTEAANAKY